MDTPATPPPLTPPTPLGPLGWIFVITLLAPLVPLLLSVLICVIGGRSANNSAAPWVFYFMSLPAMLGCSIACSIQIGNRKGMGMGILIFLGTQILYIGAAVGGCIASATALGPQSFH
jgi:hypothetical protein